MEPETYPLQGQDKTLHSLMVLLNTIGVLLILGDVWIKRPVLSILGGFFIIVGLTIFVYRFYDIFYRKYNKHSE